MVSIPETKVITWITTHLPTQDGWKAELAHSGHFVHKVVTSQP